MGMTLAGAPSGLADALFSSVEQRLLALLFGQPGRRYQTSELIRLARTGNGAAQRVLGRLAKAGLITVTEVGNQKHYQANRKSPVFDELHGLVVKTVGLVEPLRQALEPFGSKVRAAFVYGSIAKGTDRAGSDIDLAIVSDELSYLDLFDALHAAERQLAREVSPNIFTEQEWQQRRAEAGSFVARIDERPRLFVIGSSDELA